jgi:hypothetical protein
MWSTNTRSLLGAIVLSSPRTARVTRFSGASGPFCPQ